MANPETRVGTALGPPPGHCANADVKQAAVHTVQSGLFNLPLLINRSKSYLESISCAIRKTEDVLQCRRLVGTFRLEMFPPLLT